MPLDELIVCLGAERIGTIVRSRADRRSVVFTWDSAARNESIRLSEGFAAVPGLAPDQRLVSRFFGGYLPEGSQRLAMAEQRGIRQDDLFGFLREYGGSLAGALSFRQRDEQPTYAELSPSALNRALKEAIGKRNQGTRDDSRSMIPGFQPKVLVARFGSGGWMLPHGSAHSTHILKPARPNEESRILDEHFAHELARSAGLSSYGSEIRKAGSTRYLAIERYDREVQGDQVVALHQEDAAQAMALDWVDDTAKFQDPGHPRNPQRASAYRVAEVVAGLDEEPLTAWLRQLTFRVAIGDNDGHAKNVGIIHRQGTDDVSDLYDAVPNLFQAGRVDWTLAFAVDGQFDHRKLTAEHLIREARSWGMRERDAESTVRQTLAAVADGLAHVSPHPDATPRVAEAVGHYVARLREGSMIGQFTR
ncbi:type II toxin-antitoxin system HipA family toxin [Microbacterium panaciterrae]|uniref:Type II toxin-antitoxin system HipA family toxin n=1 Tax=Microbacterium panaciterrae TaxID=985759 RepID=A0ABP8PGD0_9MICO